ncbi:hypothetical protein ACQUFT_09950 [Mammaliicoccus lentus]|jgi:protein-S-isoprenylcysteine O-methyltransferase Ste14|uniref:Steroid 5-alpha reductase C-terminal domain-containing protein n=2 Tax=Staphylococcaceae TaxID=90964 RepID=A0AAX3W672_MAMLE|nr:MULTISPECIES: hypothetical protein [Mammaliicoccus]HBV03220.1 hypothetical protein [Staphylococcus sp.]MBF0748546.1 hypothetical protein [Mammaliicoccus lentus]MBF0795291.1 hypothetical protein [Mammaliicoccus lentus]MBW0761927.1 hypothetical protein [Mammaliicoccus lentus]MBW0766921.1 hypothetical protein [Mammaliicoccus lentus]
MAILVMINIILCIVLMSYNFVVMNKKQHIDHYAISITIALNGLVSFIIIKEINFITIAVTAMLLIWAFLHTWIQIRYVPNYIQNQFFVLYIIIIIFSMSLNIVFLDSDESIYQSLPYFGVSLFIFGQIIAYLSLFTEPTELNGRRLAKTYQKGIYKYFIHPRLVGEIVTIVSYICMIVLTPHWFLLVPVFLIYIFFILWQKLFKTTNYVSAEN